MSHEERRRAKADRVALGLEILTTLEPGKAHSWTEIAAWCDCSETLVKDLEAKALANLRKKLKAEGIVSPR